MMTAQDRRVSGRVFSNHFLRADELDAEERAAVQEVILFMLDRASKGQLIIHKVAGRGWVENEIRNYRGRRARA